MMVILRPLLFHQLVRLLLRSRRKSMIMPVANIIPCPASAAVRITIFWPMLARTVKAVQPMTALSKPSPSQRMDPPLPKPMFWNTLIIKQHGIHLYRLMKTPMRWPSPDPVMMDMCQRLPSVHLIRLLRLSQR